jgi:outer membrane biosynthesis protein TonB
VSVEVELFKGKWLGSLLEEGPQQSLVRITKGPAHMVGLVQCVMNEDWVRVSERKSPGRSRGQDYDKRGLTKTKESRMSDESVQSTEPEVNYVEKYNELVAEAVEIGLNAKPISTRFRDTETGIKRCEALVNAIAAQREKIASGEVAAPEADGPQPEEPPAAPAKPEKRKKKMAKTSAKKKAVAPKRAVAPKKAAKPAAPKAPNAQLSGVEAEFCDKGGTLRGKAVLYLHSKKNKKVPLAELYRHVYDGKPGDAASMVKLKTVVMGITMRIDDHKLPYKVEYDGKGEDLSVTLGTKSGR